MKTITSLCLALLTVILPQVAVAQAKPDKKADAALAKLAAKKRGAALKFTWKDEGGGTTNVLGAFVSKEGFALVGMAAVTTSEALVVVTAGGKRLKFGTILKLFPKQGAALMKFDHKPDVIVPVGKKEPEIGETIALIPWDADAPQFGDIRPVVGNIMLKRIDISTELKDPKFLKVLSLGSGLYGEQKTSLAGSFAINMNGDLVARYMGSSPYPDQTLIGLYPVAEIANEIGPLAKGEKGSNHPLPPAVNMVDPALLDPEYRDSVTAMIRGDMDTSRRLLKNVMKRHPNNLLLQAQASNLMILGPAGGEPLIQLKDVPPPDPSDSKARQYLRHNTRSVILKAQGKNRIPELVKAIECSPKECIAARVNLAKLYENANPPGLAAAAELYRQVYEYGSDTIHFVNRYQKLLRKVENHDEAKKVSKRYRELLTIYSRSRG